MKAVLPPVDCKLNQSLRKRPYHASLSCRLNCHQASFPCRARLNDTHAEHFEELIVQPPVPFQVLGLQVTVARYECSHKYQNVTKDEGEAEDVNVCRNPRIASIVTTA